MLDLKQKDEFIGQLIDVLEDWFTDKGYVSEDEAFFVGGKYNLLSKGFDRVLGEMDVYNRTKFSPAEITVTQDKLFEAFWVVGILYFYFDINKFTFDDIHDIKYKLLETCTLWKVFK